MRAIPADLSRHDECRRLSDLVTADSERLDILVNNAGALWDEPLATFPDEAWDTVVDHTGPAPAARPRRPGVSRGLCPWMRPADVGVRTHRGRWSGRCVRRCA
ncbi:SDR family NAD(P)-dependent oxidoreductase [Streptomyces sp. Qhu-G9]|nr:SDR family NAD(P)-dependent oxidoreductase [Streptomyces aurantiacus]WAU82692.1 SDR family NAD(P)-dependent oxidoreductase [Streptomyces aurantiacus]